MASLLDQLKAAANAAAKPLVEKLKTAGTEFAVSAVGGLLGGATSPAAVPAATPGATVAQQASSALTLADRANQLAQTAMTALQGAGGAAAAAPATKQLASDAGSVANSVISTVKSVGVGVWLALGAVGLYLITRRS